MPNRGSLQIFPFKCCSNIVCLFLFANSFSVDNSPDHYVITWWLRPKPSSPLYGALGLPQVLNKGQHHQHSQLYAGSWPGALTKPTPQHILWYSVEGVWQIELGTPCVHYLHGSSTNWRQCIESVFVFLWSPLGSSLCPYYDPWSTQTWTLRCASVLSLVSRLAQMQSCRMCTQSV